MQQPNESAFVSPVDHPLDVVPVRVVSLAPSLTETLFDLDLGDRLIAVTDHCTLVAEPVYHVTRVGTPAVPDIERVVSLNPDLVLLSDSVNCRNDAARIQSAGIPVWVTGPSTVLETLNLLWDIMAVFDHGAMSARVREIERAYDYQQAASATVEPVRVFAPVWCDPWIACDSATYTHDLLRVCGGINVAAEFAPRTARDANTYPDVPLLRAHLSHHYVSITLDHILDAQPDIILLPGESCNATESDIATLKQLDIPAAHHDQMFIVNGSLLTWPGTRSGYALRDLPALIMGAGAV